jgi:hypothetical protein
VIARSLLVLSACSGPARDPVMNHAPTSRIDPVIRLDRARPLRDCPRGSSKIFSELPGSQVTFDACLRGKLVGDSIAVNASQPVNGRIASRRAIVDLEGHVLLHGTETIGEPENSPPIVVALVDLDGDGKHEILEEDEVVAHQRVTRIWKVYEDSIVELGMFPHALEDGRHTCHASWTIEGRMPVVSATIEPAKRSSSHDGLFDCLAPGRHRFTIEDDRLIET